MAAVAQTGTGNVTTAAPTSGASVTLTRPASTAVGDLLVCFFFHHQSGGSLTPPAGWTSFGVQGNVVGTFDAWWHPVTNVGSEPSSYTFTRTTGSDRQTAIMFRVTGADLTAPVDVTGALVATGTATIEAPAAAPTTTNALLLACWASSIQSATPSTVTAPGTMTQVSTVNVTSGNSSTMTVAQQSLTVTGATGTRIATVSPAGTAGTGFMVAIRAAQPTVTAPTVPTFYPGVPVGSVPAEFNAKIRAPFTALLSRPRFRARRTGALTVTENAHQYIAWDTIDEDSHGGWAAGTPGRYTIPTGWAGWWLVTANVSLFGTGANGLVLIPSIAVNGASQTGVSGGAGWEGPEPWTTLGGSGIPKTCSATWRVYAVAGDYLQLDLYYSSESAIVAVDTTAGQECRMEIVWDGI